MSKILLVLSFVVPALFAGCASQSTAPIVAAASPDVGTAVAAPTPPSVPRTGRATVAPFTGTYSCNVLGNSLVVKVSGGRVGQFSTWGGFGSDWTQGQVIAQNAAGEYVFPVSRWFNFTHETGGGWAWESVPNVLVGGQPVANFNGSGCGIMNTMPTGLAQGGAALMRGDKQAAPWPVAETPATAYAPPPAAARQFLNPGRATHDLPSAAPKPNRRTAPKASK